MSKEKRFQALFRVRDDIPAAIETAQERFIGRLLDLSPRGLLLAVKDRVNGHEAAAGEIAKGEFMVQGVLVKRSGTLSRINTPMSGNTIISLRLDSNIEPDLLQAVTRA